MAVQEKRDAYNKRHAFRVERGDDVRPYSSCPADWLPGALRALAAHLEGEIGEFCGE